MAIELAKLRIPITGRNQCSLGKSDGTGRLGLGLMMGGWKFAAVSEIGTSHLRDESPVCQDNHRCVYLHIADALLCVLSDGAGSAAKAEQGSLLACHVIVEQAQTADADYLFTPEFAHASLAALRAELLRTAECSGMTLRDYACTLVVAIATPTRACFYQIGDGAICIRIRGQKEFVCAFWPTKGEYANMTQFVTDSNADEELEFESEEMQVADLALFSDGLERLALDFKSRKPHGPFFTPLFPFLYRLPEGHQTDLQDQMAAFLQSDRVNAQTDDDKTLILATRERG